MMSTMIKLEKNTDGEWDAVFGEDGDFELCEEGEACTVEIVEGLLLTRVEALASQLVDTRKNPLAGCNWYGTVLDDSQDQIVGELEIKRVILGTPGVISIPEWQFTRSQHTATFTARVLTQWGEVALSDQLGLS